METLQNMERDTEKAAPGKGRRRRRKRASLLGEDIGIQADFFRFLLGADQTFVGKHHVSLLHVFGGLGHRAKQTKVELSVSLIPAQWPHPLSYFKGISLKMQ